MRIAIDASRANKQHKTGTEWYSYHVIEELKKITTPDDQFLLYTNNSLTGGLEQVPTGWQERVLAWPPKYLWTQIRLWWELIVSPPDVLFVPAHTIPLLPIPKRVKIVATVHDVGFKRFPELYKPIQIWYHDLTMRRIRQRADTIITISEFSKQEIIECYHIAHNRIVVIPLGYNPELYQPTTTGSEQILEKYKIRKPYLLYVGRLEKKKNIGNLIASFALAKAQHPDLQLVLVGSAGNEFELVQETIRSQRLESEIIITGYVPQAEMPALISGATAFMFITLYEGFGLPIIEALACGVPVVASDQYPHREVGGDIAHYVDPRNPEAVAAVIDTICAQSELEEPERQKRIAQAQKFLWSQTAAKILAVLRA
jgi:glycosyltransferase involved in cell wall biosynthesis